ncbi:hypothetical protein BKA59DRAFT_488394 [Fusarium tricinctum]|uniref:Nucleotide-diphospho-sugar transferase domain-containing protein n=1 Tax=Fusarium tricinctum TaxID=61284 RepID=A0A8K0W610_9HYPO|nr:hypothetical protein BKA59DRAFT_488394 [Fusarium tricinctum]
MTVPRSNRAVVLAAVVFITIFLGLAHFHLKSPIETSTTVKSGVDEPAPAIPEKEVAATIATYVPGEDEEVAATPVVPVVTKTPEPEKHHAVTPDTPEVDPAEAPSDPEEIAEAEEQAMKEAEKKAKEETKGKAKGEAAAEVDLTPSPAAEEEPTSAPESMEESEDVEEPEAPEAPAIPEKVTGPNLDVFTPDQWIRPAVKVNDPEYYPYGHWPSKLPSDKPIWNKPLGKKLCIIDLESRRFDKPGQLWSDEMTWNKSREVHGPSGGSLNHWVYAKIHGYEYYHIKINGYPDRRDSWKKPSVLSQVLKKHDVCVFIDSDALFNKLDLPMEWLMNYWSIDPKNNSMALPYDPDTQHNRDRRGNLFLNTGFMIMQNKKKIYEIFKEWDDCANEGGKFPGCTEFRNRKGWQPTDQGGFGTFIRYEYGDEILSLPCTEANGFPESNSGCDGKFIKHVWIGKEDRLVQAVGAVFPGVLLETFHKQFLKDSENFKTSEDELIAANGPPW